MPYELSFRAPVTITDRDQYINECCVGGDLVADRLLPAVRARYDGVDTGQEDWGWYIWFRRGAVRLAIDIFTDDPDQGAFRIHLTARTKKFLMFESVVDAPELDEVRALVVSTIEAWTGGTVGVEGIERH
jgi:hypothetical protein